MLNGETPGPDVLRLIMRAENASITWLAAGIGPPFLVHWSPTDEACRAYLDEILAFQNDWTVHRLTDGGRIDVLIVHAVVETEEEDSDGTYTEVHVLAGVGRATLARVASMTHRETLANTETVTAVASGEKAGTWDLLGDDGLLTNYQTIEPAGLKVAEQSDAGYGEEETDAISQEERQWVELIRRLDPDNRVRLKEVGHAFVAAERDREAGNDGDD